MAARLVLLSFPDYKEGEEFARQVMSDEGIGLSADVTVEWVTAQPTVACKCAMTQAKTKRRVRNSRRDRGSTDDGFTILEKWGWWVHAKCDKPTRMVVNRFATNKIGGSYDLLPQILKDPTRVPNDLRKYKLGE